MIQTKERIRIVFIDDIPMCGANYSILLADKACQTIALMWTKNDIAHKEVAEMLLYRLEFQFGKTEMPFGKKRRIYSVDTVYDSLIKSCDKQDDYHVWKCRQKALFKFASDVGYWFNDCGLFAWAKQQQVNK